LAAIAGNRLNVALYVSDDSVEKAVLAIAPKLRTLHYRRNTPSLGHDRNLLSTLTWPKEDYVWLLRSAMWAKPKTLEQLIAFLDGQDLILVNSHSDDHRMVPSLSGAAGRTLLREALWHQTLTGGGHRLPHDRAARGAEPHHRRAFAAHAAVRRDDDDGIAALRAVQPGIVPATAFHGCDALAALEAARLAGHAAAYVRGLPEGASGAPG
jgi:hypothetical protein